MTWVKIDDGAAQHPKLLRAGPNAVALWLAGLCYANRYHTDGLIPRSALGALYPSDLMSTRARNNAAAQLVRVGLWLADPEGWRVHEYALYQSEAMRSTVSSRREADRERQRKHREANELAQSNERVSEELAQSNERVSNEKQQDGPRKTSEIDPLSQRDSRAPAYARQIPSRPDQSRTDQREDIYSLARVEVARSALRQGYAKRYRAETNDAWMGESACSGWIGSVAAWCASTGDPEAAAERVLDGAFANEQLARKRWPWAWIAQDPAAYAAASTEPLSSTTSASQMALDAAQAGEEYF